MQAQHFEAQPSDKEVQHVGATIPGGSVYNRQAKPASYEDYINPEGRVYVERANPLLINWGQHKTSSELKTAGLIANREPIPGDWDYEGSIDQGGG